MNVLIFKNTKMKSLSTLEIFLTKEMISHKTITFMQGDIIPDLSNFDTLVILGGYMSANDGAIYPFINDEINIARDYILAGKRVLGICLGSQIMAKSLGAKVFKGNKKETGWYQVHVTETATQSNIIKHLTLNPETNQPEEVFPVFQWHEDTFELPENTELLASTSLYSNQGFIYGSNTFAVQFHFEVSQDMIDELLNNNNVDRDKIIIETDMYFQTYTLRAYNFYRAFFN